MRQAIRTKYLGATNHRGSRIKAVSGSGLSVTVSWDHEKGIAANHACAAVALAAKFEWFGVWHGGDHGDGYTFVMETDSRGSFDIQRNGQCIYIPAGE